MMANELKQLGLPTMCANALSAVGVKTFDQLLQVTTFELKAVPSLGAKGVEYVLALVASKGYKLQGQEFHEQRIARKKAKRQWVGLTDEEYFEIGQRHWVTSTKIELIHAEIEAKLKEKNT